MTNPNNSQNNFVSVLIDRRHIPFMAIIFFVFLNAFFNSIAFAYGYNYFPFSTFLYLPDDLHADLIKMSLGYFDHVKQYDTSAWSSPYHIFFRLWEWSYFDQHHVNNAHMPPFSFVLGWIVSLCVQYTSPTVTILLYYSIIFAVIVGISLYFKGRMSDFFIIFIGILSSYPVLFVLTRGNIFSFINSISLIFFMYLLYRKQYLWLAALFFAISINIRPNVLLLSILFLMLPLKSAIKYLLHACLIGFVIFIISLWISHGIDDFYTFSHFLLGLHNYVDLYVIGDMGTLFNNSLYGALKTILIAWHISFSPEALLFINKMILLFGIISILIAAYLKILKKITEFEFMFVSFGIYVLISTIFATYHLVPFILFLLLPFSENDLKKLSSLHYNTIIVTSVFLLVPKNYIFIHFQGSDILSIETILNPIVLTFAIGSILLSTKKAYHIE